MSNSHHDLIDVTIVEDQRPIREGLATLIDNTPGFRCKGCFGSMEKALPSTEAEPPDVLLVDLGLPGMSGVEGIRRLATRRPDVPVLVLAVYDDDERIFGALLAGACGHILKTSAAEPLFASLRIVAEGAAPMSPEAARQLLAFVRDHEELLTLDAADARIVELLADGYNYSTAAEQLGLTPREIGLRMKGVYDRIHLCVASATGVV